MALLIPYFIIHRNRVERFANIKNKTKKKKKKRNNNNNNNKLLKFKTSAFRIRGPAMYVENFTYQPTDIYRLHFFFFFMQNFNCNCQFFGVGKKNKKTEKIFKRS